MVDVLFSYFGINDFSHSRNMTYAMSIFSSLLDILGVRNTRDFMNRIKLVILGTFLATVSSASFSQNANAYEVVVHHDHVDRNVLIARYDRDRHHHDDRRFW